MLPVLLIHGYSTEGKKKSVADIYGSLPDDLKAALGQDNVLELDLSRWISLSDGIRIDDVSFAMERALRSGFSHLLKSGFHAVVHSTGALVVRNWLRNHSEKPSPLRNMIHLAGANFGSGLAHIGQGQLARWGRLIFTQTGRGVHILRELEFGSWKTLDLQAHFLTPGNSIYHNYQVQEFCIVGSHIESPLHMLPIRYIKEDSSDNTVRTSACNLNYRYYRVRGASSDATALSTRRLKKLVDQRLDNETVDDRYYAIERMEPDTDTPAVPFTIPYKTSHFGEKVGIVSGEKNRDAILPLVTTALDTPYDLDAYAKTASVFARHMDKTFERVGKLKFRRNGWNRHWGYEGHSQLILRIRDQYGTGVRDYDVTFRSINPGNRTRLESLIEDRHANGDHAGTETFYFRTQQFQPGSQRWRNLVDNIAPMHLEITGTEADAEEIRFVPLNLRLSQKEMQALVTPFQTTIVDVELVRLPAPAVFSIERATS
jgi:hypothetical protein